MCNSVHEQEDLPKTPNDPGNGHTEGTALNITWPGCTYPEAHAHTLKDGGL